MKKSKQKSQVVIYQAKSGAIEFDEKSTCKECLQEQGKILERNVGFFRGQLVPFWNQFKTNQKIKCVEVF